MRKFICGALMVTLAWSQTVRAEDRDAPVLSADYLSLVAQYLYRWHLDETALLALDNASEIEFRYGWLQPKLDEGDKSQFVELFIPQLNYLVVLKKSDYEVPELDLIIQNERFRVYRVERYDEPPASMSNLPVTTMNKQALIEHLFSTRNERVYPSEAVLERMRAALREHYDDLGEIPAEGPQTIYVAPISEVSNTLWVFWENARRLIRFSSDSDLNTKAYWDMERVGVHMYDLENKVVISHAEAAGSNAFVTRDWAARALFNCIVFGQRRVVEPIRD
jgi:hypothetical protein